MKRLTDRRRILFAAGTAAAAMVAGAVSTPAADIQGTIAYEGGGEIPKGRIAIHLEDTAPQAKRQSPPHDVRLTSDGGAKAIEFSLEMTQGLSPSPGQEIVARLERADGWLLARGSATFTPDAPVQIVLYTVMY